MTQHDEDTRKRRPAEDEPEGERRGGDDEDIQIVDVEATDEAGVPLDRDDNLRVDVEPEVEVDMEDALPAEESKLRERIAGLEREVASLREASTEAREQLLRTAADFENFRRRTDRDRLEERRLASSSMVKSLLPVLDGFGRALDQAKGLQDDASTRGFVDGMRLIESQLLDILKQAGLEAVDISGTFDPTVHEALMQEATQDAPHMSILAVFEPGYRLGGRLLRPARVKVAHNPSDEAGRGDPDPSGAEDGS
jgi:molecular chaperone GrpE